MCCSAHSGARHTSIRSLILEETLAQESYAVVCKSLSGPQCRIEVLDITNIDFGHSATLLEAVACNRSLRRLRCGISCDDPKVWPAFIKCLRSNRTLLSLLTRHSAIAGNVLELPAALAVNRSLSELEWDIGLPAFGFCTALQTVLLRNRSLTSLKLGHQRPLSEQCDQLLERNLVVWDLALLCVLLPASLCFCSIVFR